MKASAASPARIQPSTLPAQSPPEITGEDNPKASVPALVPKPLPVELAIVVPTFNECGNVVPLIEALGRALAGVRYEVVFVDDDSPDGTAAAVRQMARTDPHLRILQRIGRR